MRTDKDVPTVSLEKYIDARFLALEIKLESEAKALDHRLSGMNEFRSQITQERGEYARKNELNVKQEAADKTHDALEIRIRILESGRAWLWGAMAALGFILMILDKLGVLKQ